MNADLRHLARNLRRSPASALAAVITLTLTLGAGTALFALVDRVLLTPLPFDEPDALMLLGESPLTDIDGVPRAILSGTLQDWRRAAASAVDLEAFDPTNLTLSGIGPAERVSATYVTPGFFRLLGVSSVLGRPLDERDAGGQVIVVSTAFWRARLQSDPGAIGRDIALDGRTYSVVGVMPDQFWFGLDRSDLWIPLPATAGAAARVRVVGRLVDGVTPTDVTRVLGDISRLSSPPARAVATPIAEAIAGPSAAVIRLLIAAAGLVTLVAVINLAGLLIVRAMERQRELAVRSALGATRTEVVKQVLLEAHALVLLGAAGGAVVGLWLTPIVGVLAAEQGATGLGPEDLDVSWRVIAVLGAVAIGCAWASGLVPALRAARQTSYDILRRGTTPPPSDRLLRRTFVVGEVAVAFVLLASVLLVGRSLTSVLRVDPGFDASDLFATGVGLSTGQYRDSQSMVAFYRELRRALMARLDSQSVAIVNELPLTHDRGRGLFAATPGGTASEAVVRVASEGYFDAMKIDILEGRGFDDRDDPSAPPRVVVSRSLASRLFGGATASERQVWLPGRQQAAQIVGVVADVKHRALDEGVIPTAYFSIGQQPSRSSHIVIRSERNSGDVLRIVREEVARLDDELPVARYTAMTDMVSASPGVPARRVVAATFAGFALLAMALAGVGLFGIMAHDVARRGHELALRIALGADPAGLSRSVLWQGGGILAVGLTIGFLFTIVTSRMLGALLFGIGPHDVTTLVIVAFTLSAVALVAVLPPARRASRSDPIAVLRGE